MKTAQEAFEQINVRNARDYQVYKAWYTGDPYQLQVYSPIGSFWRETYGCTRRFHMPIAAEMATVSADLLFAEPPSIFVGTADDQQRLDELATINELTSKLYCAAELCAAYGDVYLKLNWNSRIAKAPIINVVHPMLTWPEYEQGIITSIHFFSCICIETSKWEWTHEIYTKGFIYSAKAIGASFTEPPQFMDYTEQRTGLNEILAVHIKNMTPRRMEWDITRGRSDYEGLIGVMDALDEAYSSWIRDVNLGKARLIVPSDYFHNKPIFNTGEHVKAFDKEDEIFVAMDIDPQYANGTGIFQSQFDIRDQQHKRTCDSLLERIITSAGYSPQTFGLNIGGSAESGTALNIRERKTYTTKAKKELYWRTKLEELLSAMLKLDELKFNYHYSDTNVRIEFKEPAQDLNNVAEAISKLSVAGAISTYEMVKHANPDWNDDQIQEEVNLIQKEKGMLVDDPYIYSGEE